MAIQRRPVKTVLEKDMGYLQNKKYKYVEQFFILKPF